MGVASDAEGHDAGLATDGTVAVTCCGTVDNRDALRALLKREGYPVDGPADAEVLIAGFRRFGKRLPFELRVTFAVAITDGEHLWSFRDHLGLRSLLYARTDDGLFLASEAKQVAAGTGNPIRADRGVVERIFWTSTASAIRGVERLMPATLLEAAPRSLSCSPYWNPVRLLETARPSAVEVQEQFDALMTQAVRRCLTGQDVIALSGGLDLPTVVGYAAPLYQELFGRHLPALSIVAPDHPSVDETEYIKLVVDRYQLPWNSYEQRVLFGGDLDRWVELCDGPVPTVTINEMEEAYSTARRLGFRTMLTGEWAEFLVDQPYGLLVHLLVQGRVPDEILDRSNRTVFDASIKSRINYQELDKWLNRPNVTLAGVDYSRLQSRLESRELDLDEYRWARDLASAHAFLERYGE